MIPIPILPSAEAPSCREQGCAAGATPELSSHQWEGDPCPPEQAVSVPHKTSLDGVAGVIVTPGLGGCSALLTVPALGACCAEQLRLL